MKSIATLLACAAITGCAASVETSNARTVVVKGNRQQADAAQQLADAECAKHGRIARLSIPNLPGNPRYVYDCVQ
jgi:hypothetical protein